MKKPHYNRMTQKEISIQNQNEIKVLTEEIAILKNNTSMISDDVKRMLFYFDSDNKTKSEGFIEKSNRHDRELKRLQEVLSNIKFSGMAATVIISSIASVITFVILTWDKVKS